MPNANKNSGQKISLTNNSGSEITDTRNKTDPKTFHQPNKLNFGIMKTRNKTDQKTINNWNNSGSKSIDNGFGTDLYIFNDRQHFGDDFLVGFDNDHFYVNSEKNIFNKIEEKFIINNPIKQYAGLVGGSKKYQPHNDATNQTSEERSPARNVFDWDDDDVPASFNIFDNNLAGSDEFALDNGDKASVPSDQLTKNNTTNTDEFSKKNNSNIEQLKNNKINQFIQESLHYKVNNNNTNSNNDSDGDFNDDDSLHFDSNFSASLYDQEKLKSLLSSKSIGLDKNYRDNSSNDFSSKNSSFNVEAGRDFLKKSKQVIAPLSNNLKNMLNKNSSFTNPRQLTTSAKADFLKNNESDSIKPYISTKSNSIDVGSYSTTSVAESSSHNIPTQMTDSDLVIKNIYFDRPYYLDNFKSLKQKTQLVESALKTFSTKCILKVILFLRNTLSVELFQKMLSTYPTLKTEYCYFLEQTCSLADEWIYTTNFSPLEMITLNLKSALSQSDYKLRVNLLENTIRKYEKQSACSGLIKIIADYLVLYKRYYAAKQSASTVNRADDKNVASTETVEPSFYDMAELSIIDLANTNSYEQASLKTEYKLTDIQYEYLLLKKAVFQKKYSHLASLFPVSQTNFNLFQKMKKQFNLSPIDLTVYLYQNEVPSENIKPYINNISDIDMRLRIAQYCKLYDYIIDYCVQKKDRNLLISKMPFFDDSNKDKATTVLNNQAIKWRS